MAGLQEFNQQPDLFWREQPRQFYGVQACGLVTKPQRTGINFSSARALSTINRGRETDYPSEIDAYTYGDQNGGYERFLHIVENQFKDTGELPVNTHELLAVVYLIYRP